MRHIRFICFAIVTWIAFCDSNPARSNGREFASHQFYNLRRPVEQDFNQEYQNDPTNEVKSMLNTLPVKTTTTHTKFSTDSLDSDVKSVVPKPEKENSSVDTDPVWWSEYPIPFVGTTSNSDEKWTNDPGKDLGTKDDINAELDNRHVAERSIYKPNDFSSESSNIEGMGPNLIKPDFGPLALPIKQEIGPEMNPEMSPPLRRIQKIVPLTSFETKEEAPDEEPQNKNLVYSSLMDMIHTAEELRKRKPAYNPIHADSLMMEEEPPEGESLNYSQFNPERIKESQDAVVEIREDWKENLIIDWDPAKTPLTTAVLGSVMLFIILVVVVLALRVHCRNRQKLSQEWIRHPIVQPPTSASGTIQPNIEVQTTKLFNSEPIRIKAKGLLERRGSNTSLTIDLPPNCNCSAVEGSSPTRECTPEEFLASAGNRMNRKQLRQCLYDPRVLHVEFWQIPSNHPEKCLIPGSTDKNRYRTVLPNEETRVKLSTPEGQHRYINANYIRGYDCEENAFIATQGPLINTTEDLWLMALQEKSPAIVMITKLKEKGRVKCEPYIPSYSGNYNGIQITVKQIVQKNGYTIRDIQIKRGDLVHNTLHFWFTSWPDHKTPSSARHLLNLASEVDDARKVGGPVIVHCSAGIGRTGCFIAIHNCMHQLLEEDCVDVLATVCHMRLDRGGMVQTPEQYEFIHRALCLYETSLPFCGRE